MEFLTSDEKKSMTCCTSGSVPASPATSEKPPVIIPPAEEAELPKRATIRMMMGRADLISAVNLKVDDGKCYTFQIIQQLSAVVGRGRYRHSVTCSAQKQKKAPPLSL